ncbi:TetR/AcrR family transcriptional regulator [Streptomyces sp. DSM 41921]|uniref:TetR/AcrR family transcriptional regulator n=1 Tax=Streptomyces dubilierae TaxID=3075533 RepID=A0ABU2P1P6_9ACTN|nr:TetR/AcrR family transcriptional regulator [Streptomyces sp. DSM 41921]MDA4891920.1 TetR/AcrR family transcriptional regulator [Streptomyces sp. MS2A]MDT0386061.1 TetR/AcrR family transcriptional regulator [Streptomyces sp. DSM 41921]
MSSSTKTRRLTAKGRATRDRIVAAAAAVMYERGVAGTSTEDILAAAQVTSPSQLYHYFADKKSLVQAVIEYQTEHVLGFQRPLLQRLDSFEALEAWRDAIVQAQHARSCKGGCPIGSLAAELSDADPQARTRLAAGYAQWEGAIRDGLVSMQERGELDEEADADDLSLALLTALQGGLLMTQTRRDTVALEAVLNAMIDRIRCHAPT